MKKIVIICGPSASGKNTIVNHLLQDKEFQFKRVVSYTDRPDNRVSEQNGQDYHFISTSDFKRKILTGFFFEHTYIRGNYYGTPINAFEEDGSYLAIVDIADAIKIKNKYSETFVVYIDITSEELISRLSSRGEDPIQIKKRLEETNREHNYLSNADLIVPNHDGDFDKAYFRIKAAIAKFLTLS